MKLLCVIIVKHTRGGIFVKKIICSVFLVILAIAVAGCNSSKKLDVSKLDKSLYDASQQSKDVTLSVKEQTITPQTEEITLVYTNNSSKEYIYGEEPHLEMEVDGIWYVIPVLDGVGWNEMGYILSPKDSREDIFTIKTYYGKLEPGNYRIIKTLHSDGEPIFIIGEFKVEK